MTGGTKRAATPRRRSTTWIRERPTRPLPSTNGMDGLELGVGDGRLRHRGQVVPGDEGDEVVEQRRDQVLRRRDEGRVGRVAQPAADPVLLLAERGRARSLVAAMSTAWIASRSSRSTGSVRSPIAIASSIAETFAATVLALPRAARGSISARARLSEVTS